MVQNYVYGGYAQHSDVRVSPGDQAGIPAEGSDPPSRVAEEGGGAEGASPWPLQVEGFGALGRKHCG